MDLVQLLFIYGTLKRDFPAHSRLLHQKFIGIATTTPEYGMFRFQGFPGLVDQILAEKSGLPVGRKIYGELYEIDDACLVRLDEYEGNSFVKKEINLDVITLQALPTRESSWSSITRKKAYCYLFNKNLAGASDCGSIWLKK